MVAERGYERVILVGDVHGCLEELQQLLMKCEATPERDLIILVGDLVNKGPNSVQVCLRSSHSPITEIVRSFNSFVGAPICSPFEAITTKQLLLRM